MYGSNTFYKKSPIVHILTFNGSKKIVLKVPQTLTSKITIPFITDSCCVPCICRTSSRDNITNKSLKKLKIQHKRRIDKDRRYYSCKNCRKRNCDISTKLWYDFFKTNLSLT